MNFKYIISYGGLIPFFIFLIDIHTSNYLDHIFILNMSLYMSCIIFTFIGAYNWDFYKDNFLVEFYGFIPSLISMTLILLNQLAYEKEFIFQILVLCLLIQLTIDFILVIKKLFPMKYFINLRIPVTGILSLCLILISRI